jgi:hypothetical protein
MNLKISVLYFVILEACGAATSLTPPVNHNGPLPTGNEQDCANACTNLRYHGCPAGNPTPEGAPCETVCLNTESSGYASMNPRCVAKALDCSTADACSDEADPDAGH